MGNTKSIGSIAYSVALRPNPNKKNEPAKAYGNTQLTGVVDLNTLATHIIDHNSTFSCFPRWDTQAFPGRLLVPPRQHQSA